MPLKGYVQKAKKDRNLTHNGRFTEIFVLSEMTEYL